MVGDQSAVSQKACVYGWRGEGGDGAFNGAQVEFWDTGFEAFWSYSINSSRAAVIKVSVAADPAIVPVGNIDRAIWAYGNV